MSGEIAFGAAISEDRKHGSIVAAGRSASGKILVDLAPFYDHPRLLVARMAVLYLKHDPVAVVVNPKAQSGTLIKPLAEAGIVVLQPDTQDVAVAHGEFLDLVNDGALEHLDQPPMTAAVRAAQQRPLAGANAWDPKVTVDQGPLVAATLACWAFARWEELATPGVWQVLGHPERYLAQFVVKAALKAADEVLEFSVEQEPFKLVVQVLEFPVIELLAHAYRSTGAVDQCQHPDRPDRHAVRHA